MDSLDTLSVGGIDISIATRQAACEWIIENAKSTAAVDVHLVNAYTIALAAESPSYRAAMVDGSVNYPDGKPLAILLKAHRTCAEQVRGPSLFRDVLSQGRQKDLGHFLLGGSPSVLASLLGEIQNSFPGCRVVGSYSPPFRDLSSDEWQAIADLITASGADVVWVGLGTPKQDYVCKRIASEVGVTAVAIGAAFDFLAGAKREAPRLLRFLGLEWLHRLISEPRRLWRRYVFGNGKFVREAARTVVRSSSSR